MIPDNLQEAYLKGDFGIYIGSGVSQASGLPSWKELLTALIDLAETKNTPSSKIDDLKQMVPDPSKYLLIAEELREILSNDLYKYISEKFDDDSSRPSSLLNKILLLEHKFIITTNYDTLIEKAYVAQSKVPNDLTYKNASTINLSYINNKKFILKAHGDARRSPEEIIITEHDYRHILLRERGYQSVMHTLFSTSNILFMGASLQDPDIKLLLGFIYEIFHAGTPAHFAFMSEDGLTPTEVGRWRKDFSIEILSYNPKNNHKELEQLIEELQKVKV